jgi:hypothetical protein
VLLRVAGLDTKGFWQDEAITVYTIKRGFGGMLRTVVDHETTPPLYYVVAWAWAKVFGYGEVGLRSLSTLAGVAAVPISYLAAKELVSRRAGLVTALLVAVNPLLVWYGQEARSYALLVPLSALTLLLFARALHAPAGRLGRETTWWALASAATIATHHFALFLVLPELLWLLRARGRARPLTVAAAVLLAVSAADLVLAAAQRSTAGVDWIAETPLPNRIVAIPGSFLIGFESPSPLLVAAVAAACAAVALWLAAARTRPAERQGAALAFALAVAVVAIPLVLALGGSDYVFYRNVLPALIPALVAFGAGFGAARAGMLGAAALGVLCVVSLGVVAVTRNLPKYRKEVWREVAAEIGPARGPRAIVITPRGPATVGLTLVYLPGTGSLAPQGAAVREIVIVAAPRRAPGASARPHIPRPASVPASPVPGFRLTQRVENDKFTLLRYRSARAVFVVPRQLQPARIDTVEAAVLLQPR